MPISVFTVTLTSGQCVPAAGVDLGQDGWQRIAMKIPTSPSGSVGLRIAASGVADTYYPLVDPGGYTSPVATRFLVDSW